MQYFGPWARDGTKSIDKRALDEGNQERLTSWIDQQIDTQQSALLGTDPSIIGPEAQSRLRHRA